MLADNPLTFMYKSSFEQHKQVERGQLRRNQQALNALKLPVVLISR